MDASDLRDRPRVAVVGGSAGDAATLETARLLGEGLAGLGCVLVNGGLSGTMEATGHGYKEAGGALYVGILPGTDRADANRFVDLAVPTGLGHGRNMVVALNGDVVVALPGAGGTLSEVGYARVFGRPVVAVGAWEGAAGDLGKGVTVVETVEEAVEAVRALLGSG